MSELSWTGDSDANGRTYWRWAEDGDDLYLFPPSPELNEWRLICGTRVETPVTAHIVLLERPTDAECLYWLERTRLASCLMGDKPYKKPIRMGGVAPEGDYL